MNEYLQIAILALIQGAAEILPVSSSAHVIVAERLLGMGNPSSPKMTFLLVMLHTGTMFAVLFYFWSRWKTLLFPAVSAAATRSDKLPRFHFVKMVILATVLTGVLGYGLMVFIQKVILVHVLHENGEVEELFKYLPLMAISLLAVGILIIAAGTHETKAESIVLTPRSSIWIGIIQGLCLPFRGFSRSGATISTALYCGISRPLAEDFSFALAVVLTPAVIGRSVWRLLKDKPFKDSAEILALLQPGLVGMVFSFIAGFLALIFLSWVLEKGRWKYFGYYCLVAAMGVLAVHFGGY